MRTTVELDDALFRRAKAQAALRGIKFKELVQAGLKLALASPPAKKPFHLKFPILDRDVKGKVKVPRDVVHRLDDWEDRMRDETSLRR